MINLDKVPSNLEQALELLDQIPEESKDLIRKSGAVGGHFSIGMWLRNNWSLWEKDTPIVLWFKSQGIVHADDMSGIILESFEFRLKNQPFDLKAKIKHYRDFWKSSGIDPDTMESKKD